MNTERRPSYVNRAAEPDYILKVGVERPGLPSQLYTLNQVMLLIQSFRCIVLKVKIHSSRKEGVWVVGVG